MSSRRRVALFDLDHTLLPFDSDYAWGEFTTALGWTDAQAFAQRNADFYRDYQAGTLDIHAYVRFATAAIVAQGASKSEAARAEYISAVVQKSIKNSALNLVRSHQASGDAVVIVTATNAFVTQPIAQVFGVQELIAIELARDPHTGWYSGEIAGVPSFREGKVQRVHDWLLAHGLDWDRADLTFYSDSINDLPLLERVHHPVATNPDARLRAIAQARGWRILDLFGASQAPEPPVPTPAAAA
ncbi:MAG: HAD family hydrolase [Rhodoferax sp.]